MTLLQRLFGGTVQSQILRPFERILVVRQHNQLGDMICAVPMLRCLRNAFPRAHITLVASPVNYDVMRNHRCLDDVVEFRKTDYTGVAGLSRVIRMISNLRSKKFDLAIVPATVSISFTSDLIALLSGATMRRGARSLEGKDSASSAFFNSPVVLNWKNDPHRHQTLRNMDMLEGICPAQNDLSPEITLTDAERKEGRKFVQQMVTGQPVVAFHPGAGKVPNRWPSERFAQVAKSLHESAGARILIVEGPMDEEPAGRMRDAIEVPYQMVSGKPVREVAAILSAVNVAIVNDTGIMHVAAAVGTPVLSLFGPTDPEQWAPIDGKSRYIKGRSNDINTIEVEAVLSIAHEMLKQNQSHNK